MTGVTRTLEPQGQRSLFLFLPHPGRPRGSGQPVHNHRASNHLTAHILASQRLPACLAALPRFPSHAPEAVNYKSGFSTVSSSQPGSSPSFSFVNEAKIGLFPILCLASRQLSPCPSSLSEPPFVPSTRPCSEAGRNCSRHRPWMLGFLFPPFPLACMRQLWGCQGGGTKLEPCSSL